MEEGNPFSGAGSTERSRVQYEASDKLEIALKLYLNKHRIDVHDLDNRLKDCLDALQGRAGGSKKIRRLTAIIPNDRQVFRVVIEKKIASRQARGLGHLTIRRLS